MNTLKHYTRYTVGLILFTLLSTTLTLAQNWKPRRDKSQQLMLFTDSATATAAEFLLHLEMAYQKIDSVQTECKLSPEIILIEQRLIGNDSIVHFIDQSLVKYNQNLNLRNLEILKTLFGKRAT